MKVLWLTPTPSLAEHHLSNKPVNGGWIKSLEKGIQERVDLSVTFYHWEEVAPFTFGKTRYFPINVYRKGKWSKIKSRISNSLESQRDIDRFLAVIAEVKPDIIHIHGTEGPFGLIQQHTDIPCVVSFQGCINVILYRYFSGITYFNTFCYSRLKNWLFFRTYLHTYWAYIKTAKREKAIFKYSKNIIGRTAWDKRVSKVLAPMARYFHNDEILRDSFYTNRWQQQLKGAIKLFTTTGPGLYKGLETILYSAYLLEQQGVDFQLEIAGVRADDEIAMLATKSAGVPLSTKVHFTGILNETELVNKLLQTHLYLSCSHIENSPNSLCEAQILGVPCIATNAGGTASLMEDGKEGLLIQDGDPYALAGAILELVEDYDRARWMGANGRKRALDRHDPEKIVNDLLSIYQKIKEPQEAINTLEAAYDAKRV